MPPVSIDSDICGGMPVFSGTRVPIDTLLAYVDAGKSIEEYLLDYDVAPWKIDAVLAMPRERAHTLAAKRAPRGELPGEPEGREDES